MNNIIENFIINLRKEDIIKFASKNHLKTTDKEIDFVYSFIKNNYKQVLKNPNSFDLAPYKSNFSNENYTFLNNLISKYRRFLSI